MRGMRTPTSEFRTDNLQVTASSESTPLSRVQQGFYERQVRSAVEHLIPGTNLYIIGFGLDSNGNSIVRVQTPNQRSQSIQTNGTLPVTNRVGGRDGMSFFDTGSPEEIAQVEQEVKSYVDRFPTPTQKKHYRDHTKKLSTVQQILYCKQGAGLPGYLYAVVNGNVYAVKEEDAEDKIDVRNIFQITKEDFLSDEDLQDFAASLKTKTGFDFLGTEKTAEIEEPEPEEQEEINPADDGLEEPSDTDYIIYDVSGLSDHVQVGIMTGNSLGEFSSLEDAEKAINKDMTKNRVWPNVRYINDHGNVALYPFKTAAFEPKTAAIFDGYGHRLTIETRSGQTNGSYTLVINMLQDADIRYREVRRYTIDPDRVCMDILIRDEDLDVVTELAKEVADLGISMTFNDNISEAIKPKQIVTLEKDLSTDKPEA